MKHLVAILSLLFYCNIIAQPTHDDPCGAIPLDVNDGCIQTSSTNVGATNSSVSNPSCGGYNGEDVWFVLLVPANGAVNIDTDQGTLNNMSMAAYSSPDCNGPFTEIDCDADASANGAMPLLNLTGLTPGSYVYIRMFDYYSAGVFGIGANPLEQGTFSICASSVAISDPPTGGGSGTTGCGPNNPPLGNTCAEAPMICNLDGYCGSTSGYQANYWNQLGGNNLTASGAFNCGSIENNSFGMFIAGQSTIQLEATVNPDEMTFCYDGIQIMIFSGECDGNVNSLLCESEDENGGLSMNTMTYNYTVDNLVPGDTYYIMIDGFAGDQCDYIINAVSGVAFEMFASADQTICLGQSVTLEVFGSDGNGTWTGPGVSTTGTSITVTPNAVGTYTYSVTADAVSSCGGGGSQTFDINVTVLDAQPLTIASGPCNSGETVLTASGGTNYTWTPHETVNPTSGATTTASPLTQTTYTVTGTTANGCPSTATVVVDPCDIPCDTPTVVYPTNVCEGSSATPSVDLTGGTFSFNPSGAPATIDPNTGEIANATDGVVYTIEYSYLNNCADNVIVLSTITGAPNCDLDICDNGTSLDASGGDGNYTWYYETTVSGTTPITNQQECIDCPTATPNYFFGIYTGCSATDCATTTTDFVQYATGANAPYPPNFPIQVTDGSGSVLTFNSLADIANCSGCIPPTFTVTPPAALCSPATYDLTNTVSGTGVNIVSYHATNTDANSDINPLASTVVSASGTYYVRVEDPGDPTCFSVQSVTVTINTPTDPTFNPVAPICSGDALAALPTTSTNGVTGTWSPALNNTATTTYTFTPGAGQCANSTTLTITVNTPVTPTFDGVSPICSGDALAPLPTTSNNGITGSWTPALNNTATTTYTFTPDAGQCATTTTLTITVNPNVTPTFNPVAPICSGDALAALPTTSTNGINGNWAPALNNTATSTYTFSPSAGQCATTADLTIMVNPIFNNTENVTACENSTYTYPDGFSEVITGNTAHTSNLTTAAGCDSIIVTNVTMQTTITNTVSADVCDGDTYTFADGSSQTISANTSLTTTLTSAGGCDSVVTENITMISPLTNTVTANVCDGDTYTFADGSTQTITANTSLTTVLTAANGCDSTVTEDITMISPVTNTVTVNLCSGSNHTYADGTVSNNITANESYTSTLVGANGCDSTVTENVVIGPNITNTVTANVCDGDTYTFADGSTQTITANVSLSTTLTAANGCDSIVTEDITMISPVTNTVTVNICSGANHTYADGTVSNNITANESYTSTLTAANGCDSLVTEDLVIGPNITNTITANVCDGDTYTFADGSTQTITANVSLTTTLTATNGCDSVVTEDITMVPVYNITENVNACQNATYTYPDGTTATITANTSYTSNLTSVSGCDSIIVTNVTMNPVYAITDNITVCSGSNYTYPDGTVSNNITVAESHVSNLTTSAGCDSIITTNISISTQFTSSTDFNICSGSNYTYADGTIATNVTVNESYTSNFVSASGCDSLVTENLIVLPVYNLTNDITVCEGETVTYPDGTTEVISASTSQTSNLITGTGCDSIIVTNVTMNPIYNLAENVNACENSTYTYPDGFSEVITGNTAHTSNLTTAAGCDSIIVTNVTMDPVHNITENVDACENATYTYPDGSTATITASTAYTSNLTTAAGCDSIIVTNVNMVPALTSTNNIAVCENETVTYPDGTTEVITASTTQTSTLTSTGGCDSIVTTNVTMNPIFNTVDNITVCEGETITYPDGTTEVISVSTTQTSTLTSAGGCDSIITTNVTMNPLPTFTLASTDPSTCGASDGTITIGGLNANSNYQVSYNSNAPTTETTDANGDILITGLPTGTYTDFIVEDANGCQTIDNSILNISPLDAPSIDNVSKVDLSCAGDQSGEIHIIASGGTGIITYTIDDGAGFTETNTTGDFVNLNPGTYSITITDDAGCQSTSQVVINEPGAIVQNVASTDILCFGDANGTITWTSVVGGNPPYQYSIDNGNSYGANTSYSGLAGGTYNVTVTDLNGCNSDTSQVVIFEPNELLLTSNDVPVNDPTCLNGSPSCNGDITINVPAGGGVAPYTYIWPNNIAATTSNMAVDLCGGQYNIAVEDANGCTSILQVNLVDPVSPVIDDLTSIDAGCGNDCNGVIDVTSSTALSFEINGNQNGTGLFENMCQGTYDVIVTGANNCSVSQTVVIDNASDPNALFTFDPGYASLDYPEVTFTNLSEFSDSYYWWITGNYPNDSYFWGTSQEDFTHTFPTDPGTYTVCLSAQNSAGCADTLCTNIEVQEDFNIYVPNAFTPDGDGINNTFKPVLTGIDILNYELLIFNRWGELIFESHNKEVGWDGMYQGKLVQDGVYVWKINVKMGYTDERRSFYGHVTVLK